MNDHPSLATLLSYTVLAFTIEFDNEAEHQIPHRTTNHGRTAGSRHAPWLVSLVMWLNCMRFVTDEGITVRDLELRARTKTNLNGMKRWGYVSVTPDPADRRPKPPRSCWLIRPTRGGKEATETWKTLLPAIADRWQQRFGDSNINRLRESLIAVVDHLDPALPDCLPILHYGLYTKERNFKQRKFSGIESGTRPDLPLISLLSKVLLAFAIEFESESDVSMAVSANVLRIVPQAGVRLRDLPRFAGVSKEGIAMAVKFLVSRGYATIIEQSGDSRVKMVSLTSKGEEARNTYFRLMTTIEARWKQRFGERTVLALREALEQVVNWPGGRGSSFWDGLVPYAGGWRASRSKPAELPHFPMILHRGGFPDGS